MSANPSTVWYWNDWDNDQALRMCSLAAQGLWMRMLSLAARAGGYLKVGDLICGIPEIAAVAGRSIDEVAPLVAELETKGVFSRDRKGVIYNRRMISDEKRRKTNQKNGQKGGATRHGKQRTILPSVTEPATKVEPRAVGPSKREDPLPLSLIPEEEDSVSSAKASETAAKSGGNLFPESNPAEPDPPKTASARDPVKELFDAGLKILHAANVADKQARSLIGGWRRKHGDAEVMSALVACRDANPSDPVPYIIRCLSKAGRQGPAAPPAGFENFAGWLPNA